MKETYIVGKIQMNLFKKQGKKYVDAGNCIEVLKDTGNTRAENDIVLLKEIMEVE